MGIPEKKDDRSSRLRIGIKKGSVIAKRKSDIAQSSESGSHDSIALRKRQNIKARSAT